MSGERVFALFDLYKASDFIMRYHETLHIESPQSIVKQIDEYITEKKKQ
jgi:hypothetical protein